MNVIIDSNVFRKDFLLTGSYYEILFDYLDKTNSKVIFTEIVLDEVIALYKKQLEEKILRYKNTHTNLSSFLIEDILNCADDIDVDNQVNQYKKYLETKLKIPQTGIIRYKNEYLPELVRRAINRIPPMNKTGQQFRDSIIWFSILDYVSGLDDKRVVFISENTSDFADKEKIDLNDKLLEETKERNIEVIYYNSLESFCRSQGIDLEYLTREWIEENVSISEIEKIFTAKILEDKQYVYVSEKMSFEPEQKPTGHFEETSFIVTEYKDYFVYEKSDKSHVLNIKLLIEKEFEMGFRTPIPSRRMLEEYGSNIKYDPTSDFYYINVCPSFYVNYAITIKDRKIIEYKFINWSWY